MTMSSNLTLRERLAHEYACANPTDTWDRLIASGYTYADAFLSAREPSPDDDWERTHGLDGELLTPAAEPVREAREEAYRHAFEPLPKGARVAGHEATAVERAEICRHCGDGPEHPDHEAREAHCVDCCCARAWKALGITEYTGKSIPEHIAELRAPAPREAKAPDAVWTLVETPSQRSDFARCREIRGDSYEERGRLLAGRDRVNLHVSVEEE